MTQQQRKLLDHHMENNFDEVMDVVLDILKVEEVDQILDSEAVQNGMICFNFLFGKAALRWIFTTHTFMIIPLMTELGRIHRVHYNREEEGLVGLSLTATYACTTLLWVLNARADEEDNGIGKAKLRQTLNKAIPKLNLLSDMERVVKDEMRHHIRLYVSPRGHYHCGRTNLQVRTVNGVKGVNAKVIPISHALK